MDKMMELKDKLCQELDTFELEPMTPSKVDAIYKLASAVKNLEKIMRAKEDDGYSGGSYGSYRGSYDGGSYNEGGSYARGRRNAPRDSMGRYSGDGYSRHGNMAEELRNLMETAPDSIRRDMEKLLEKVERQ